jgi:hypothetical protein
MPRIIGSPSPTGRGLQIPQTATPVGRLGGRGRGEGRFDNTAVNNMVFSHPAAACASPARARIPPRVHGTSVLSYVTRGHGVCQEKRGYDPKPTPRQIVSLQAIEG